MSSKIKLAQFVTWSNGFSVSITDERNQIVDRSKLHPQLGRYAIRVTEKNKKAVALLFGKFKTTTPCKPEIYVERLDKKHASGEPLLEPLNIEEEFYVSSKKDEEQADEDLLEYQGKTQEQSHGKLDPVQHDIFELVEQYGSISIASAAKTLRVKMEVIEEKAQSIKLIEIVEIDGKKILKKA